jgi:predicted transcriptional regulator
MKLAKRFTLYLEPSLFEKLRTLAFNKRVSVAELIRQAVEAFLEEEK